MDIYRNISTKFTTKPKITRTKNQQLFLKIETRLLSRKVDKQKRLTKLICLNWCTTYQLLDIENHLPLLLKHYSIDNSFALIQYN